MLSRLRPRLMTTGARTRQSRRQASAFTDALRLAPVQDRAMTVIRAVVLSTLIALPLAAAWGVRGDLPAASGAPASHPGFSIVAAPIDSARRAAMLATGSWHAGCPVAISQLRSLRVGYWGFDRRPHAGVLVVNRAAIVPLSRVFRALWRARFAIRRMAPVEAYGASDERSMAADNTSAFNCRRVPGSSGWSQHAYGLAVDVNPLENPEVRAGVVDPPSAARYADRRLRATGMIHPGDAAVNAFAAAGWAWGGDWHSLKDWQHFSANGL